MDWETLTSQRAVDQLDIHRFLSASACRFRIVRMTMELLLVWAMSAAFRLRYDFRLHSASTLVGQTKPYGGSTHQVQCAYRNKR